MNRWMRWWMLGCWGLAAVWGACTDMSSQLTLDEGPHRDTGPKDTGPKDTGDAPKDTGPKDTGPKDTGPEDTGPEDTGPEDTGADPLAIGAPCNNNNACESGFCADGVCCASACDGDCGVCNATGAEGTCTPKHLNAVCREASGHECDAPEVCDGVQLECPTEDAFNDGAPCGALSDCVLGGVCTAPDVCELDLAAVGAPCGSYEPSNVCDAQDTCDAAGVCQAHFAPETTVCDTTSFDQRRCASTTTCEADVEQWVHNYYCDGAGACGTALVAEWWPETTCEPDQICVTDGAGSAHCADCDAQDHWPDFCDGDMLNTWVGSGQCADNQCTYQSVASRCKFGCKDGVCLPDPYPCHAGNSTPLPESALQGNPVTIQQGGCYSYTSPHATLKLGYTPDVGGTYIFTMRDADEDETTQDIEIYFDFNQDVSKAPGTIYFYIKTFPSNAKLILWP